MDTMSSTVEDVIDNEPLREIDRSWLHSAIVSGIQRVITQRKELNRINVFPVADSDTGTNLALSMKSILAAMNDYQDDNLPNLLERVADSALDGARGNSGAIFAQFWVGFSESISESNTMDASALANAVFEGSRSAHGAIANPVDGTMLSVMRDCGNAIRHAVSSGIHGIAELLKQTLERTRESLASTTELLDVLKQAGVVDAGALGFVEFLTGFTHYASSGSVIEASQADMNAIDDGGEDDLGFTGEGTLDHRFCSECVVTGSHLDRRKLHDRLVAIDSSSLVIAGTRNKLRVHVHVNNPAELFLICEEFGEVSSQKADDMQRQSEMGQHKKQRVAVITDTGADLPDEELERLNIHLVPLRVNLQDRQYMDKISLSSEEYYDLLKTASEYPTTSQPPPGDYRRQFEFLISHYTSVICLCVSAKLSGTWQAASGAAQRVDRDHVTAYDTMTASTGQGLMTMWAAEAAHLKLDSERILEGLNMIRGHTRTFAVLSDLASIVRGGRMPGWVKRVADLFRIRPVICSTEDGVIKPAGFVFKGGNMTVRFARWLLKRLDHDKAYRLLIAHCDCEREGRMLKNSLVSQLPMVHSALLCSAGAAIGAHAGPGSLVIGVQEYISPEDWLSQSKKS